MTESYRYHAFLSYSQAVDGRLAPALRAGLHGFAKPLYKLRALNVFRDTASLAANPALWTSIEVALGQSEHFILLASPQAAGSPWVAKEVGFWCDLKPIKNLLLVLTDGEIVWDETSGDFDWQRTTALPRRLHGVFTEEPRWVDLRWARKAVDISLHNARFRECVAELAAPLHKLPKDELLGRDVELLRATRRTRRNFIVGLILLAVASITAAVFATRQWHDANTQRDQALRSQSVFLAQLSHQQLEEGDIERAILLAREGLPKRVAPLGRKYEILSAHMPAFIENLIDDIYRQDRPYVPEAEAALYKALKVPAAPRRVAVFKDHRGAPLLDITHAAFSPDGRRIVTAHEDGTARLWEAATGRELAILRGHEKVVLHASFSPDGTHIATASADRTARIWDALSARELIVLKGHQGGVFVADFSPDGQRIVTASGDGTARLWDANTGAQLMAYGHPPQDVQPDDLNYMLGASISPDGRRLVTVSLIRSGTEHLAKYDYRADLWETETGKHLATFPHIPFGHKRVGAATGTLAEFTPDGKRVVTVASDRSVRFWRASDGSPAGSLQGHEGVVRHAAFTPDGKKILTGSADGTARMWDLATYSEELSVRPAQAPRGAPSFFARVQMVAFSPDQSYFVTVTSTSTRLWDAVTGEPLAEIKDIVSPGYVTVSPKDGRYLALLSSGGNRSAIWEVSGGGAVIHEFAHGRFEVTQTALSANGRYLLTASADGTAVLWDGRSGARIAALGGHTKAITHATFSPEGTRLLTTSADGTARLWHVPAGTLAGVLQGHGGAVLHGEFSSDGRRIVSASTDQTARIWDATSSTEVSLLRGHEGAVIWATFSGDGRRVLTASDDYTARIWDAVTARQQYVLRGHEGAVYQAHFSPDGTRVVTVPGGDGLNVTEGPDCDGLIDEYVTRLWDGATGKPVAKLKHCGTVVDVAFSPDGSRVLTASADTLARVWRLEDGARVTSLGECIGGDEGALSSAAFGPDGRRALTVMRSGRVNIWNIERHVKLATLHTYRITRSRDPCFQSEPVPYPLIYASSISADHGSVVTAGTDGVAHLLRILPTSQAVINHAWQRVPRELTPEERRAFLLSEP